MDNSLGTLGYLGAVGKEILFIHVFVLCAEILEILYH